MTGPESWERLLQQVEGGHLEHVAVVISKLEFVKRAC